MKNYRNYLYFYLNNKPMKVTGSKARLMLADYLRYEACLVGTKVVCAEGDCGACTVLRHEPTLHQSHYFEPINSCISPLLILDGSSLVTVEALAPKDKLHPVQQQMVDCHGSQCGFCTPGFVMAFAGLVEKKKYQNSSFIKSKDVKNATTGNLCRCTGYESIIKAGASIPLGECESLSKKYFSQEMRNKLHQEIQIGILIEDPEFHYFAPTTLGEAIEFLSKNPETKIIGSSTDLGVVHNKRKTKLSKLLSLHLVPEMYEMSKTEKEIKIGSKVSIEQLRSFVKNEIPELDHYLDLFASPQIKNIATVVGNIANASPIGDLPPALMSLDSIVHLIGPNGKRTILLSDFFEGYRKTKIQTGEVITGLTLIKPEKYSTIRFFKNSNRKDLDISAVNLSIHVKWEDQERKKITHAMIAGGGLGPTPIRFPRTEKILSSKTLDKKLVLEAANEIQKEFQPISDLRASKSYRRIVVDRFFKRFFHDLNLSELQ